MLQHCSRIAACVATLIVLAAPGVGAQSWERITNLDIPDIQSLTLDSNGGLYVNVDRGAEGTFLYRSTDEGESWKSIPLSWDGPCATGPDGTLYCSQGTNLVRSNDGGESWTTGGYYDLREPFHVVTEITVDNQGVIFLGTEGRGVLMSGDYGDSWQRFDLEDSSVRVFSIHATKTGELFIGAESGLYRLNERRDAAIRMQSNLLPGPIYELFSAGSDTLLASVETSGTFYSSDRGATWMPIYSEEPGLGNSSIRGFARDRKGILWGIPDFGAVAVSLDNGASWTYRNNGIAADDLYGMTAIVALPSGRLFAGRYTGALYRTVVVSGVETRSADLKSGAALSIDHARPREIRLDVHRAASLSALLFDPSGSKRAVLIDGTVEAGIHLLPIPSYLPSGLYLLRIISDDGTRQSMKIVVSE